LQLLNNLLESARMEAGELSLENRDFPIRVILGDVRQMVIRNASAKDLKLIGTCDSHVPEVVCGDELKVRQVLLNLVHNAVKFTERGEVNLSAEVTHRGASTVNIRFSVKDTGIGIKAEDREKLFKPFSQAEDSTKRIYGGSGLGLNISKRLVELMGGTLSFESEYEKGSRFWCDIPFSVKSEAHD
jgi:signal transduction histidine kinase